jgi:hypothetical protein
MATHPKRLRKNNRGTLTAPNKVCGDLGGRINIQNVISIAGETRDTVCLAPCSERTHLMLIQARSKRDLIVLKHENRRKVQHRCEIYAFMKRGGFRGTIANPRQCERQLATLFKRKRDPCKNRS